MTGLFLRVELLPDKKSVKNSENAKDPFNPVFEER
jgi:hypothetical protein